jgi:hypothetical protein
MAPEGNRVRRFGSAPSIDSDLEAALVSADGYTRRKAAKAQAAIRHSLDPGERLLAVGVDIDNVTGVAVVTDRRLLAFGGGVLSSTIPRAQIRGAELRRLSSSSFLVTIEDAGVRLTLPTNDAAQAFIRALTAE